MAITLKYGSPAPILATGFAAGMGHRQNKRDEQNLELWQREQERQFLAARQEDTQAFQAQQQQAAFDFRAAEGRLDREQRLAEQRRQQDFLNEQNTMAGLRRGELYLPGDAQTELNKLEAGRVESRKQLDDFEQQAFDEQYYAKRRKLLALARPSNEMSYDERLRKGLGHNYEQYKNLPWQFDNQGEMSLPTGFKMPGDDQAEAEQKFNQGVMKRYEKNLTETDPQNPEKRLYADENKALQAAIDQQNAIERGRQRLLGSQSPKAPQTPVGLPQAAVPRIGGPTAQAAPQQPALDAQVQNLPPEIRSRITPEAVMEAQRLGATDPVRSAIFLATMRAGPEKQNTPAITAEKLPAATRSKLARPQTREEIDALTKQYGPGVEFEWTDGRVYRTK